MVQQMREGKSIEELISCYATEPILSKLESQMALLCLAERLGGAALIQQVIAEEIANNSETAIPTIGFKALATACELCPRSEDIVVGLITLQDLHNDKVEERLCQVLHVAHLVRLQVSWSNDKIIMILIYKGICNKK